MITYTLDVDSVIRSLPNNLKNNKDFDKAVSNALNHASRNLKNKVIGTLRNDLGFPSKRTSPKQFKQINSNPSNLEVILLVNGSPIPINEFKGLSVTSKYIKTKYTDKYIKPSQGFDYFKITDWRKVQSEYLTRYANGKKVAKTTNGLPLNFMRKKNSSRVSVQQISDTFQDARSQSSALYDTATKKRREMDEVFGISAATAVEMPKFYENYASVEEDLHNDFENKLIELLVLD